ncbi:MAG: hypothetical protein ACREF3_12255, partial [Acetobacteraceae bacterium]
DAPRLGDRGGGAGEAKKDRGPGRPAAERLLFLNPAPDRWVVSVAGGEAGPWPAEAEPPESATRARGRRLWGVLRHGEKVML